VAGIATRLPLRWGPSRGAAAGLWLWVLVVPALVVARSAVASRVPGLDVLCDLLIVAAVVALGFRRGFGVALGAAVIAAATHVFLAALGSGPPVTRLSQMAPAAAARLVGLLTAGAVAALLSARARREARQRLEHTLEQLRDLEACRERMQREAETRDAQFEESLMRYTALMELLEESAQKIYSSLEFDRLFQSFFRVLAECFGAERASVYLKDSRTGAYFLADRLGPDAPAGDPLETPLMLRADDPRVVLLERSRRGISWRDEALLEPLRQAGRPPLGVLSGLVLDSGRPVGILNVDATDGTAPVDTTLMTMVCNIASIALGNARLFGQVQWMAKHDPLTRLYNREAFHEKIDAQIDTASGRAGPPRRPFALLMLDIDHFKALNDAHGHQAGDAVLEWFADQCQACAGDVNLVFRYGGEEFTVLMPGSDAEAAHELAERIRRRVESTAFHYDGTDLHITLSCGIAVSPGQGAESDDLVRRADEAMYRAKDGGRNLVVVGDSDAPPDPS